MKLNKNKQRLVVVITQKHKRALSVIVSDRMFSSILVFDFEGLYIKLIMENRMIKIEQIMSTISNILPVGSDKKADKGRMKKLAPGYP